MSEQQELAVKKELLNGVLELIDGKSSHIFMPAMFASLDYIAGNVLGQSKDKEELDDFLDSLTLSIITLSDNIGDSYHKRRGELRDEMEESEEKDA